jgi:hypothetical protein
MGSKWILRSRWVHDLENKDPKDFEKQDDAAVELPHHQLWLSRFGRDDNMYEDSLPRIDTDFHEFFKPIGVNL